MHLPFPAHSIGVALVVVSLGVIASQQRQQQQKINDTKRQKSSPSKITAPLVEKNARDDVENRRTVGMQQYQQNVSDYGSTEAVTETQALLHKK